MTDQMRFVCSAWGCFELTHSYDGLCPKHEAEKAAKELMSAFSDRLQEATE